jgi:uncharacterized RDD family membrane protein YckC
MDVLLKIGAVIVLLAGAVYPLIGMMSLATRLNKKDVSPLTPAQVFVRLMLIATVPLAGILGGLAGFLPAIWASDVLRLAVLAAAVASIAGFIALFALPGGEAPKSADESDPQEAVPED